MNHATYFMVFFDINNPLNFRHARIRRMYINEYKLLIDENIKMIDVENIPYEIVGRRSFVVGNIEDGITYYVALDCKMIKE